ncbi:NRDE family protein [Stutzerimonas balearica]|uniref:NRDE family protein n=1 Tax=Stutzerimonas balearica TaxID=74829 RepID=UPI00289D43BE|nr:NRDE family protein [Stutzerimonas balearica]
MCLIVLAWRPGHPLPLVVAANRDEFHKRPSLALGRWEDAPEIIAGRDLQAGGTWMGITETGRFAALTNIRIGGQPAGKRSRGELPEAFLRGEAAPESFLRTLCGRLQDYAGFNLLVGDRDELWHLNSHSGTVQRLPGGIYGLSNADLDSPWPKLERARAAFTHCLLAPKPEALLELLADRQRAADSELPSTGVPLEWERLLSSIFITSPGYGTRASTALLHHADGRLVVVERSYAADGRASDTWLQLETRAG